MLPIRPSWTSQHLDSSCPPQSLRARRSFTTPGQSSASTWSDDTISLRPLRSVSAEPRRTRSDSGGSLLSSSSEGSDPVGEGVEARPLARPRYRRRRWQMRSLEKGHEKGSGSSSSSASSSSSSDSGKSDPKPEKHHHSHPHDTLHLSKKTKGLITFGLLVFLLAAGGFIAWQWGKQIYAEVKDFVVFPEVKTPVDLTGLAGSIFGEATSHIVGAFNTATAAVVGAEATATAAVAGAAQTAAAAVTNVAADAGDKIKDGVGDAGKAIGGLFGGH
ncbi:hypothetical protein BMF94_4865 [Rhodotorula taiwanensis]|uniref:Uncharacterized protein n=1 Tax=Rhodotorula taiwanensis TaxID=741276 RepID=A0A2S5B5R8_9BASI|nr:hypothetical protein BMF94_4865 [Rhodotorula taiwanensis]